MGDVISQALASLFTVQNFIFMNIGMFIGIIFGAIPCVRRSKSAA